MPVCTILNVQELSVIIKTAEGEGIFVSSTISSKCCVKNSRLEFTLEQVMLCFCEQLSELCWTERCIQQIFIAIINLPYQGRFHINPEATRQALLFGPLFECAYCF